MYDSNIYSNKLKDNFPVKYVKMNFESLIELNILSFIDLKALLIMHVLILMVL